MKTHSGMIPAERRINLRLENGRKNYLRCVALRCVALRCVALRCVALRCVALRCVACLMGMLIKDSII